jgi:predicted MFS family arabinose efflux permease
MPDVTTPGRGAGQLSAVSRGRLWAVFLVLAAAFVMSQAYRSTIAVIAPELTRELAIDPQQLSWLTSAYFFAFSAMQLPLGLALDRFGSRRTIATLLAVAVLGSAGFAVGEGLWPLIGAQVLLGGGCASVFMGSVVVAARWFPRERFATAVAVLLATGNGGSIVAATPFAAAAEWLGWRGAYLGLTGLTALAALLVFLVVRDAPPRPTDAEPPPEAPPETLREVLAGLAQVLRTRAIYWAAPLSFVSYSSSLAIRGLWGGPYLHDVYGLDALDRGNVLLAMSIALTFGHLLYGALARRLGDHRRIVLAGGWTYVALFAVLTLWPKPALWQVAVLLALLGVAGCYIALVMGQVRALFPDRLIGRAMTSLNVFTFGGIAIIQAASGAIVDQFPLTDGALPEAAYRTVFGCIGAVVALALTIFANGRRALQPQERK